MRHPRYGLPRAVLKAALAALEAAGVRIVARSPTVTSRPLGPSERQFANAVAVIECDHAPEQCLTLLQSIETRFGRKRIGQPWRARVIDLDILMWSGGAFASKRLAIPHPEMVRRDFALRPASAIAGDWRDSVSGLSIRQLWKRSQRKKAAKIAYR